MGVSNSELFHQTYVNSPDMLPATLLPHNPPITIPPAGGSFSYGLRLRNQAVLPVSFDAWIEAVLPGGTVYGPLLSRSLTLPAGATLYRGNMAQAVPGNAPAGTYLYRLEAGLRVENLVVSADSFTFVKTGAGEHDAFRMTNDELTAGWRLWGWEDDDGTEIDPTSAPFGGPRSVVAERFNLSASPDPFNPSTALRYQLSAPGRVSLRIYDTAGREVAALVDGWREAGSHEATFDASGLPSGIYFAKLEVSGLRQSRLQEGGQPRLQEVRKLILLK